MANSGHKFPDQLKVIIAYKKKDIGYSDLIDFEWKLIQTGHPYET